MRKNVYQNTHPSAGAAAPCLNIRTHCRPPTPVPPVVSGDSFSLLSPTVSFCSVFKHPLSLFCQRASVPMSFY